MQKKRNKLSAAFISSEVSPFAKVGGLGDVAGALPKTLSRLGVDVRIIMPAYKEMNLRGLGAKKIMRGKLKFGVRSYEYQVWKTHLPGSGVVIYMIKQSRWVSRGKIYPNVTKHDPEYLARRFLFFSAASLEILPRLKWKPDVLHLHDWLTAPVSVLLRKQAAVNDWFVGIKTVLTIHNVGVQPKFTIQTWNMAGIGWAQGESKSKHDKTVLLSPLAVGIKNADATNTVSPHYAKEIRQTDSGHGLQYLFAKARVTGIINGIDQESYDPKTDPAILHKYDTRSLQKKSSNKLFLQRILNLPISNKVLLCGSVTRLSSQKGISLVIDAINLLAEFPYQFVILGTGNRTYHKQLTRLAKKFPHCVSFVDRFDERLARRIYAGADVFLMPSRFEPCGLGQIIALRYGTVPIVRDTGGLHDTVQQLHGHSGTGLLFKSYSGKSLTAAIKKAHLIFSQHRQEWSSLKKRGMKQNFSWRRSAKEYLKLYNSIINKL